MDLSLSTKVTAYVRLRPIADIGAVRQSSEMENSQPAERYIVTIDRSVTTKDELFGRVTDAAYLGYNSFSGWDAFNDMLLGRLESSDILIEMVNENLLGLNERDREIYLEIMADAVREFPQKLLLR